jgi:hypothetical protein
MQWNSGASLKLDNLSWVWMASMDMCWMKQMWYSAQAVSSQLVQCKWEEEGSVVAYTEIVVDNK